MSWCWHMHMYESKIYSRRLNKLGIQVTRTGWEQAILRWCAPGIREWSLEDCPSIGQESHEIIAVGIASLIFPFKALWVCLQGLKMWYTGIPPAKWRISIGKMNEHDVKIRWNWGILEISHGQRHIRFQSVDASSSCHRQVPCIHCITERRVTNVTDCFGCSACCDRRLAIRLVA
jgi:hypothetical protein